MLTHPALPQPPVVTQALYESYIQAHVQGLIAFLQQMPPTPYRDFMLWQLKSDNRRWLKLISMTPIATLTFKQIEGVFTIDEYEALLPYIVQMNTMFTLEIVSDNVAIGLLYAEEDDPRRGLVQAFNEAALKRLHGEMVDYDRHFAPYAAFFNRVSTIEQSLNPELHRAFYAKYCRLHPYTDLHSLEYSLYPQLVANIEATVRVKESVFGLAGHDLVRNGLIRRYSASNAWLVDPPVTLLEHLHVGIDSVMVIPALAYPITILCEQVYQMPEYLDVLADGSLEEMLTQASLLVRLTNDVGTKLLLSSDDVRREAVGRLRAIMSARNVGLRAALEEAYQAAPTLFSRMRKDAYFGEFNILLHPAVQEGDSLDCLEHYLMEYARIYTETRTALWTQLNALADQLKNPLPSQMIGRFVVFHEELYKLPSDIVEGEYAN